MAIVAYNVVDEGGNETLVEGAGDGVNLDVHSFVELDNGERVSTEGGALGLGLSSVATFALLEQEMRDYVFEDELREVAATDQEVAEMLGELEDLIEGLAGSGVVAEETLLRSLPFVVEVEDDARERLGL
jgi:hypothetical protein